MQLLSGFPKHYSWGSPSQIPQFLGQPVTGQPVAELWFGAHPLGSGTLADGNRLDQLIAQSPTEILGYPTIFAFGHQLPYMMKLVAPVAPLSLQVHPDKGAAQEGFLSEEDLGIPQNDFCRIYKDANHKPEMLLALSNFQALVGFAVRTQIHQRLQGLDCSLASKLSRRLTLSARRGLKSVVSWILDFQDDPSAKELTKFKQALFKRLNVGESPCPDLDRVILQLFEAYPTDPGILFAYTMNLLRLSPGEALYIPPGTVHSYQSGFAIEVMANSDNVIRAGLTKKHCNAGELIEVASFEPHPPTRIAPDHPYPGVDRFWAPVEDFVLSVYHPSESDALPLPTTGPRICLCLDRQNILQTKSQMLELSAGQAAFITHSEGSALTSGPGRLAVCTIP